MIGLSPPVGATPTVAMQSVMLGTGEGETTGTGCEFTADATEKVLNVTVPAGSFDLIATTNLAANPVDLDTVVYVRSTCSNDTTELTCDDEKIRQVLHNLLRNAIEATGQGGVVTICVHAEPDRAVLEVEDDGPGFPSDAPVFEPFFTTKEAGTGLGLSIVHRVVTDHGGTIDVRTGPGAPVFALPLPPDLARNAH